MSSVFSSVANAIGGVLSIMWTIVVSLVFVWNCFWNSADWLTLAALVLAVVSFRRPILIWWSVAAFVLGQIYLSYHPGHA